MHRNQSVNVHQFAMVPRSDVPRSRFDIETSHKTTFDAGYLIPIYVDEVLPGDTFNLSMTGFARMATPIFPIMDNAYLDTFFFFVPNRLIWDNWKKFMGEQTNPGDSIDFLVPECVSPVGGYAVGGFADHFGLPTAGQVEASSTVRHSALPFRAYNLIWNEWFRDENLQAALPVPKDDGPDPVFPTYGIRRRGKRHDYFTSCLPWPQKGGSVFLPLGGQAPVKTSLSETWAPVGSTIPLRFKDNVSKSTPPASSMGVYAGAAAYKSESGFDGGQLYPTNLFADLSQATAATINQIRQAFQIQKLLERDARGGTRYTEIVRSHFGVVSPDARLQRPEYLGGGSTPIVINPVAQTSGTPSSGDGTPLGNLAAIGTGLARHGFTQSFTEHGIIIGLASVRADLNYQQGLRRMWSRRTRYDFYFPAFAHLGEQAVLSKEIYCNGTSGDETVFGYQERWAEYRYHPAYITGLFRSTSPAPLDSWHLAQKFSIRPLLNSDFIQDNPPFDRVIAVNKPDSQFIADFFFKIRAARPMPLYSVPGLVDHF